MKGVYVHDGKKVGIKYCCKKGRFHKESALFR